MTYQEIKDRLSKCEVTLEKLKNGTLNSTDVKQKTEKLEILRESYVKLLAEAEKGIVFTDDEKKAKELADDGTNVKLTVKERLKEQDGAKFSVEETKSIAKSVGKAVAMSLKTLGDEVATMKARNIEENSFEIYVQYKNDADDQFSFYIVDDTLHLVDFSFDKELTDVGVKPSGEAVVNVDVLANELIKHFKSLNETEVSEAPEGMYYIKIPKDAASQNKAQVIFDDLYGIKYEINDDPKGIVMYFRKEDFDAGVIDDLEGDGVQILDTNVPMNEEDVKQIEAPEGGMDQGGDLDVGHQDDEPNMLKKDLYDVITYASKLYKALDKYDQHDGEVDFPHWWQKKVTLAREYMSAAQHYLEGEEKQPAIDQLALENASAEEENKFHKDLDKLVHKTFGKRKEELEEWGSSDQNIMNQSIHKELGEPKSMPSPFSRELESAVEDAVDHYWDDWEEYDTDREGLIEHAKKAYLRAYFKETFNKMTQMFSESMNEEIDENRFLAASMEDLEQVIRNLAHTGEMSEDEAIELAIRKLEAMLDGRDDMDEGIVKTQKAHSLVVAKMKELAKQYKAGDTSVIAQLKDLTAKKKQLEKQLEKDVAGKNRGQQLDPNINEYRGVEDDIKAIIRDKAADSGFDEQEEAMEVMEFIGQEYGIDFEFGAGPSRMAEDHSGNPNDKYVVRPCKNKKEPWAVWEGEKRVKGFAEKKDAQAFADKKNKEQDLNEQKATCCGKCGRVHVKGTECKRPYLTGKKHCKYN